MGKYPHLLVESTVENLPTALAGKLPEKDFPWLHAEFKKARGIELAKGVKKGG